jgi:hypothetical protein
MRASVAHLTRQQLRLAPVKGPFCDGWPVNHLIGDPATGLLWAGGGSELHGAGVWRSEDSGVNWEVAKLTKGQIDDWAANDPQLAAMMNWTNQPLPFADQFSQIWSLGYAHGLLYAGTKPARLLSSRDGGKSWEEVQGLRRGHPSAGIWNPGEAGLVLHTILFDPENAKKLWVGISAAGKRPAIKQIKAVISTALQIQNSARRGRDSS